MSLTKPFLGGNYDVIYKLFLPRGEFGKWHPGWGRENRKAFFTVKWPANKAYLCALRIQYVSYSTGPLLKCRRTDMHIWGLGINACTRDKTPKQPPPLPPPINPLWNNGDRLRPFIRLNRGRIFKRLWSPGIDSKESIPPAYVAWRAGTISLYLLGS
jgi:hypothetical protein